jgi:type III restriction enzyme
MSMIQADLTPMEKLKIIETYLLEVAQKIKKGYSNQRGTGKFIGYPVKEYITDYRKRVPNYDTSRPITRKKSPKSATFCH